MKDITSYIESELGRNRLERISRLVIEAYRKGDTGLMRAYAELLSLDAGGEPRNLFYGLMKAVHPDRLEALRREFDEARDKGDLAALNRIRAVLQLPENGGDLVRKKYEDDYVAEFTAGSEECFGFEFDDSFAEGGCSEAVGCFSFMDAVSAVIYGGSGFSADSADLGQIDGELNLAGYGLDELDGAGYCRNIRVLNIASNNLCSLAELADLYQLEELYASSNSIYDAEPLVSIDCLEVVDLSENEIEDAEPFLRMQSLKVLVISGNPVEDRSVLTELRKRGVIVVE